MGTLSPSTLFYFFYFLFLPSLSLTLPLIYRAIVNACDEMGSIEKITVFSKHPGGVAIVKFKEIEAASVCAKEMDGLKGFRRNGDGKVLRAHFWDGVTDYTNRDALKEEKEEETRHDAFGDWLEGQEVPDEFKVRTK